jgi:hypothetical protein
MILAYESPQWRVVEFDRATGAGTARGVGTVKWTEPGADYEAGERVFVRLRDMQTASDVWPAVAHWPVPAEPLGDTDERQSATPAWAAHARAVLEALPYPLEAEPNREPAPSFIAFSVLPDSYAASGFDVSVIGELELIGLERIEGPLPSGRIAGRVASRLERAWLATKGPPGDGMALAFSHAGKFNAASGKPCLCVVRDLRWVPHAHAETAALDRALEQLWTSHSAPMAIRHDATGAVHGRFGDRELLIGNAKPAAARRWAFAWTQSLSRAVLEDLP